MEDKMIRLPLAGNAFLEPPGAGGKVTSGGISEWSDPAAKFGIYISMRGGVTFHAALKLRGQNVTSRIRFSGLQNDYEITLEPGYKEVPLGTYTTETDGYIRFELQGIETDGNYFASPSELILYGADENDVLACITPKDKDNYGYYWTRRGPSVHCSYSTKEYERVEWFYNEVTVPEGYDPVGTYAMAIGFSGGYFGIQTNSRRERRILFSIWSPYTTDNPDEIPEDQRIVCLKKHERTHIGEFGGEGSGGQSYMKYNWKTGQTYRFLMHVQPQGNGKTVFTAYFFFPETGKFECIASFLRPMTDTWLTRVHSFLENFLDTNGCVSRMAYYGNPWGCTADGQWFRPERITLTGDNTARRCWRIDYDGGLLDDGRFFLKNGGFFDTTAELGKTFERPETHLVRPDIDLSEIQ